jgi:hypothetical protein
MALIKYKNPPIVPATGAGTFSDDLVGFQLVTGGGLTQGNFEFTQSITEKNNRTFNTGNFSNPISLEGLGVESVAQSKVIFEKNFKVYPNYDLSDITNFTLYGSMTKRISTSIESILSKFPASIDTTFISSNYSTGETASNISYSEIDDTTTFELNVSKIRNPFDIDFTTNSTRNLQLREVQVSPLRNMTTQYGKYSLYYNGTGYELNGIIPTSSSSNGVLTIKVTGNPFSGQSFTYDDIIVRPNDYEVTKVFTDSLDEVEKFLLNRNISPKYTAVFNTPKENDDGSYYTLSQEVTWPLNGDWNLDISSNSFNNYLTTLNAISESMDSYKTNLISRFLTTGAFKEFDTSDQKMEKVLQIYGRGFDDTKKFINGLAYMNSVNYNIGNDIPSKLLKNLAQTLGWETNISPISEDDFLSSVFGEKNGEKSKFAGISTPATPDELNYQFYRNLIMNSAYLFKSKGTRKSIEMLMRLIGAPDALVEFNEYIYLADQKININNFNTQYAEISGGTYVKELPTLEAGNTFKFKGEIFTGFTTETVIKDVNISRGQYPVDDEGYPSSPINTDDFFFEKGSGWFESTPKHRSPEQVDLTNSVFTGSNPSYQTALTPYSYGQEYFDRFRTLPYMDLGYSLTLTIDNNKSWTDSEVGLRSNLDGGYNARYYTTNDKLVLNAKNVDLFLNPAQGLVYDVWNMSRIYNYPIPSEGLKTYPEYPQRGGVDWTDINPQPDRKTFFEFAQTFWNTTINVRNRQFASDGGTMGYPTLQSIYWKYLESEKNAGIKNDNFNYDTMMEYVNGIGDYWVRLVEQMIPASTIWNTGVKIENSIFHRQKYAWRRQRGCQFIPTPCNPCQLTTNIYTYDCPNQSVECFKYPWETNSSTQSFNGVLGAVLTNYFTSQDYTLDDCIIDSINSDWYVDLRLDDVIVVKQYFFHGQGGPNGGNSSPSKTQWDVALSTALNSLLTYGYEYTLTSNTVTVYNKICSKNTSGINFKLNVGVDFTINCPVYTKSLYE